MKGAGKPLWLSKFEFFWAVTPGSVVVGNQSFGGLCCLHLQGTQLHVCKREFVS